ncbi:DUF2525 domain-containing protein [Pantoea sp. KPR_PJ]|uniref:DUF2525 domain-containing protein n=1 Tax=Pantoea sp. KPR_PJ TaxID=2738375 RepID=UPI003529997B
MTPTDDRGVAAQQSEKPDVDLLLDTLERNRLETVPNATEADNSRHLSTGGRAWGSSIELADEYELDIRDCSCNEMNR